MKEPRAPGRLALVVTVNLSGRPGPASGTPYLKVLTEQCGWTCGKFCRVGALRCPRGKDLGRAGGSGAGRAARSYKLYCDALTTTDGPCQSSPDLLPSALSAEQWGRSGERGQPAAVAASARTSVPQAQGLVLGTKESESPGGSGLVQWALSRAL